MYITREQVIIIAKLRLVGYVEDEALMKWLRDDDDINQALKNYEMGNYINRAQSASKEDDIIPLVMQYEADLLLVYTSKLAHPIQFISECLDKLPDTRLVLVVPENQQGVVDYAIDNGIYDVSIGKTRASDLFNMITKGLSKDDVIRKRSSEPPLSLEKSDASMPNIGNNQIAVSTPGRGTFNVLAMFSMKSIGKTTTAINTAISMSYMGLRVIVIDQNTLTPDLGAYMGVQRGVEGVESIYVGHKTPSELESIRHSVYGIDILPMGSSNELNIGAMSTSRIDALIEYLRIVESYDVVIFDLSSDIDVPINRHILSKVDKIALIVSQSPESVENMKNQISRINMFCDRPLTDMGLVVNSYQENSVAPAKIESYLGVEILAKIPLDAAGFSHSAKTRSPYVINFPKKVAFFDTLSNALIGPNGHTQETTKSNGLLNRLKNLVSSKKNKQEG